MEESEYSVIVALARCAMTNPTDAIKHQIKRLAELECKLGNQQYGEGLKSLLRDDLPKIGKIVQS